MATIYSKYIKLDIDFSCVGLARGENKSDYFCTPKDAKVIGWTGVDGCHFCFVRGFDEMVFAVSPMNTPRSYVHPVARDFKDFLRLVLACSDAALLEQVSCLDFEQFDKLVKENQPTAEQQDVLDVIADVLSIVPMEKPFDTIKSLQESFDYSKVTYTAAYYDIVPIEPKQPEWKVYFDGNFWGHHGRDRAGKEHLLNKHFLWGDDAWLIPAMYTCSKGLVVDFCKQVEAVHIQSFLDKWQLTIDNEDTTFSEEQRMQIEAENPLKTNIKPMIIINEDLLSFKQGCGLSWNPCIPEGNSLEVKHIIQHYDLDPSCGWSIWRTAFPWKKRKPLINTLNVLLEEKPIAIPGSHFKASKPGESISFIHPTTGIQHTLTVQSYESEQMSTELFGNMDQEYPSHYVMMQYTLSPDLPEGACTVRDTACSERPKPRYEASKAYENNTSIGSIGIIGGADGLTAIFCGSSGEQSKCHIAFSALHFKSVDAVEAVDWRMVFHEKRRKDLTVTLIL